MAFISDQEQHDAEVSVAGHAGDGDAPKGGPDRERSEEGHHEHEGHQGHEGHEDHSEGEHQAHDPMAPAHLFGHVQDSYEFHFPRFLGGKWEIPNFLGVTEETPLVGTAEVPIIRGRVTKFMVLELVGALVLVAVFLWLARKVRGGERPRGKIWNLLEVFVQFIRDEVARPAIGKSEADRFLPFLLTLFFFVLVLNLFGMVPWLGSPTASFTVTGVLALITFFVVVGAGMKKMGVAGFLKAQVPPMDLPKPVALILVPAIWVIEIFGLLVKHFVLAIRLFANMFAGHLVLAVFLAFIAATAGSMLYYLVSPSVVVGSVALSMLELFVAFLQAYIFVFLASLFIGMAVHPH